jgi:hypothetical protein
MQTNNKQSATLLDGRSSNGHLLVAMIEGGYKNGMYRKQFYKSEIKIKKQGVLFMALAFVDFVHKR